MAFSSRQVRRCFAGIRLELGAPSSSFRLQHRFHCLLTAHFSTDVQRCEFSTQHSPNVCPCTHQYRGGSIMPASCCHDDSREALCVGRVHVCASFHQHSNASRVSFASCPMEWSASFTLKLQIGLVLAQHGERLDILGTGSCIMNRCGTVLGSVVHM